VLLVLIESAAALAKDNLALEGCEELLQDAGPQELSLLTQRSTTLLRHE